MCSNCIMAEGPPYEETEMTKKKKPTSKPDDAEAELRKNLREHTRLERERTSTDGFREYGDEDNEDDGK